MRVALAEGLPLHPEGEAGHVEDLLGGEEGLGVEGCRDVLHVAELISAGGFGPLVVATGELIILRSDVQSLKAGAVGVVGRAAVPTAGQRLLTKLMAETALFDSWIAVEDRLGA